MTHKWSNAQIFHMVSQRCFQIYPACPCASQKWIILIISKGYLEKKSFFCIFLQSTHQVSRHEKRSQMLQTIFWVHISILQKHSEYTGTLTCQIIVQDHLIVQVADFSEINKRVGLNKAVQDEFFLIYVGENQDMKEKSQKLINVQVQIRLCRCFFPKNLIRFAARLFGRSEQQLTAY